MALALRPGYLVVLGGHYRDEFGRPTNRLAIVIETPERDFRAGNIEHLDFALQGRLHTFTPSVPYASGLWGHTFTSPGAFASMPLAHEQVAVWKGDQAYGTPYVSVRSDADGFFSLDLPPGIYTVQTTDGSHGWPQPATVNVVRGRVVAAGVCSEGGI
jgi:hypothetical protein